MTTGHVLLVVDRSGSMADIQVEAQNSINNFIAEQKNLTDESGEEVNVSVSLAHFDDKFDWVAKGEPVESFKNYTLDPRNMTALLDAVGKALTEDVEYIAASFPPDQQPDRKVVGIITDGLENASKEWTQNAVKALIQKRKEEGWQVHFLATDITTIEMGRQMGMRTTGYDRGSTQTLYGKFSAGTRSYMTGQTANVGMPDEVRDEDQSNPDPITGDQ